MRTFECKKFKIIKSRPNRNHPDQYFEKILRKTWWNFTKNLTEDHKTLKQSCQIYFHLIKTELCTYRNMFSLIKKINWEQKYKISQKLMQLSYTHIENRQSFGETWKKFNKIL